jgi:hypothetical protein
LQVRSNFDQLFAGKYEKTLDPKVKSYVESKADELYLKETGQKKSDRASQLWKSLRNVEVLKYDRGLWNTVQQTVVEQPRDARDNVLISPVGDGPKMPGHTGHGMPEKVETESKGFDLDAAPRGPSDTGHRDGETPAVTDVFESSGRRNLHDHEDAGGHTIDRHVGKSENWLQKRLATDPDIPAASTFRNKVSANRADGQFVKQNKDSIEKWLKSGKKGVFIGRAVMSEPIGRVIERGETKSVETNIVEVVVARDNSQNGWHIVTSYPVLK